MADICRKSCLRRPIPAEKLEGSHLEGYTVVSRSPEDTARVARELAARLVPGDFVALYGDLGAGKTHFVKGLAQALCPGEDVTSPTFTLVHEYEGKIPIFHFDLYRIGDPRELWDIGFYEYLDRGGVCVTEWSENLGEALPEPYYRVTLSRGETDGERIIRIERIAPTGKDDDE